MKEMPVQSRIVEVWARILDLSHQNLLVSLLKMIIGMGLLLLAIRGIDLDSLQLGLRNIIPLWLALALISVLLGLSLKLWRWQIMLVNYRVRVGSSRLFRAFFLGQTLNILLPFRGGELVRIADITGDFQVLPEVASTIVLEKYLDILAFMTCGFLVSLRVSTNHIINPHGALFPLIAGLSFVLILAIIYGEKLWVMVNNRVSLPSRVVEWINRWLSYSNWLKDPKKIIPCALVTLVIWCVMGLTNVLMFKTLSLPANPTAAGVVLISVFVGLLPALMPGNIGPFYFFAYMALLPFGIDHTPAFAYAVLLHAVVTLPPILCGFIGLFITSKRAVV